MEDFFQILIILIFIISSIVSSMNKKKKMQKNKTQNQSRQKTAQELFEKKRENVSQKKVKSSAEMLEEMFGLKVNLPEPQTTEAPVDYSENTKTKEITWDPTLDFKDVRDTGENNFEERATAKKTELLSDSEKHKAFKKEDKVQPLIDSLGIQKLFSKEANLKDYIKVQEILNKPKALRK